MKNMKLPYRKIGDDVLLGLNIISFNQLNQDKFRQLKDFLLSKVTKRVVVFSPRIFLIHSA